MYFKRLITAILCGALLLCSSIITYANAGSSYRLTLSKSMAVPKGYSYQVVADVTAYSGSDSETQTIISSEIDY